MEALAARLYRSRPRHFLAIMQALGLVLDVVAIGPLAVGAALVLFDFSTGETAVVAGTTVALAAVGTVVASALSRPLRGPVNAWARGERGDPILVWRCGTRLTKQLTTRIGDAVNVAARVEQLTKVTGDGILVTEATAASLSSRAGLVDRGQHEVRGKAAPITVLAVPCQ